MADQKVTDLTAWPAYVAADFLYVVKADGTTQYKGTASQVSVGGSSDTQLLYNNAGALAGMAGTAWSANMLTITDTGAAALLQIDRTAGHLFRTFNTAGGANIFEANGTGVGFYAVTPVAQQAPNDDLTDSTTGTADTTVVDVTSIGVADPVKCNNNFATMVVQLEKIRTLLRNYGLGS